MNNNCVQFFVPPTHGVEWVRKMAAAAFVFNVCLESWGLTSTGHNKRIKPNLIRIIVFQFFYFLKNFRCSLPFGKHIYWVHINNVPTREIIDKGAKDIKKNPYQLTRFQVKKFNNSLIQAAEQFRDFWKGERKRNHRKLAP